MSQTIATPVKTMPEEKKIVISKSAAEAFKSFLQKNKEYLKQSAGVFHTDNHSNW